MSPVLVQKITYLIYWTLLDSVADHSSSKQDNDGKWQKMFAGNEINAGQVQFPSVMDAFHDILNFPKIYVIFGGI